MRSRQSDGTVSIHASVKDATREDEIKKDCFFVSIHASVKDATAAILNNRRFDLVSIHASVKDATRSREQYLKARVVSIHASVKDATRCCASCWLDYLCFNPRICKRCDFWVPVPVAHLFCFNPRICKRCDLSERKSFFAMPLLFQSTHL